MLQRISARTGIAGDSACVLSAQMSEATCRAQRKVSVDVRRMSSGTGVRCDFAAIPRRRASRKAIPPAFFAGATAAGIVVACAWTLYANVFGASIYPSVGVASFDAPVIRRSAAFAVRTPPAATDQFLAALPEPAPVLSPPVTVASISPFDFNDRFGAAAPKGETSKVAEVLRPADAPKVEAPQQLAVAPKPKEISPPPSPVRVAAIAPVPAPPSSRPADVKPAKAANASVRDMAQRAKAAVMSIASADKPSIFEKLYGKPQPRASLLSFASADASVTGSLGPSRNSALEGGMPLYDRSTAVYDISARAVYLPNGTKLEAHSGLGAKLDDPRYVHVKMHGATPPHVYDLTPREALFHGVPALRLTPVGGENAIFGRTGLLAHTYMLGPNGDSNGCVSFKDYDAFLQAYRNGEIKRLAVVAKVE